MRATLALLALLALLLAPSATRAHDDEYSFGALKPRAASDPSPLCTGCQALVDASYDATQNATVMADLLAAMQAGCVNASSPILCDLIADAIVKLLPKLPEKIYDAGFYTPAIVCSFLSACTVPCCADNTPSQVHLSAAGSVFDEEASMAVTWLTLDSTAERNVRWGLSPSSLDQTATADSRTYTQGGWLGAIHSAVMTNLTRGAQIFYQVGGDRSGWSGLASFAAPSTTLQPGFGFLMTGDMGAELNYSAANQAWINFASAGKNPDIAIHTVIHIGDIGYADGYEERWDELFTAMEPTASRMPYMTVAGLITACMQLAKAEKSNHECLSNFSSYAHRFLMPTASSGAPSDAHFYSWDAGCIHFVALHSESWFNTPEITPLQVSWLARDLASYSQRKAEAIQRGLTGGVECSADAPSFLIVYMHRPMYCGTGGSQGDKRCLKEGAYLRQQVESLLQQHKADVVFAGHVHAYERTTNLFNDAVDPSGPVYILNGAGGNREGQSSQWRNPLPPWSVVRSPGPGLGTLRVVNGTTLHWSFAMQADLANAMQSGGMPVLTDEAYFYARV